MKRILIAGAGSYLGTAFERYIGQWPEAYNVETLSLRGDAWRKTDFSRFDVIYQVAGIAHQKETAENAQTYYEVNCDLAAAVAEQAKAAGVGQFVYLSSMSVYGMDTGVITASRSCWRKSGCAIWRTIPSASRFCGRPWCTARTAPATSRRSSSW